MDPEHSVSTLFVTEASLSFQQTRKADDFCCDWGIKGNIKRTQKLQLQIQKDMLHVVMVVAVVHSIVQALLDIMFMTYLICN